MVNKVGHKFMLIVSIPNVPDFEKHVNCNSAPITHKQYTQSTEVCEVCPISLKQCCDCQPLPTHWVSRQPLSQRTGAACELWSTCSRSPLGPWADGAPGCGWTADMITFSNDPTQ